MKKILMMILVVFTAINIQAQTNTDLTTIILIRHAEKADDGTKDPDLSEAGMKRALLIKSKFARAGIDAIYSTPYRRTQQTVAPLAEQLSLDIIDYNPSSKDFIQAIYKANEGKTILVSGHSNTTPTAVNSLLAKETYENFGHEEYGRIFIVTIDNKSNTSVLEIQY